MSVLEKIKTVPFTSTQYVDEASPKQQIYVHHTASSPDPYGVVKWWETTPDKIATSFVIAGKPDSSGKWKDGDIIQCFGTAKWAWHLGLTAKHLKAGGPKAWNNKELNRQSIGIEICSWGQLTKTDAGFKNYVGRIVPDGEVAELATPWRGFKYYQKYTQAQLDNVGELLQFLGNKWNIPLTYKGARMFDVCADALQGAPGVWTHASVRPDKNDCFPQTELISMLSSL